MEDHAMIAEFAAEGKEKDEKPPTDATLIEMVKQNHTSHALYLLFGGADVNQTDADGNTPLHLAVKCDNVLLVQAFIIFEADINKKNSAGLTPRHLAAISRGENKDVILYMLDISGAVRCAADLAQGCKQGCSSSGRYNGKPDETWGKYLKMDDMALLDDKWFSTSGSRKGDRVLCLDGGGIRGLILIQVLSEIEKAAGAPIKELFDWIGGTSTGGILALGIGVGKTLAYMRRLYFQLKDKTFTGSMTRDSANIESLLRDEFGEHKMVDIQYPKIVVTGTMVDTFPPILHLFRSYETSVDKAGTTATKRETESMVKSPKDQLIWECARSTSAAPTYFSHFNQYIDGGLMANNPTLDLLTEIHQHYASQKSDTNKPRCVVSIGCGRAPAISVQYSDVTVLPREAPDDVMQFVLGLLAKYPNVKKEIAGAKELISIIINQATTAEGRPVDRARAWCQMMEIPFNRFNPSLSKDISLGCTDNTKLINMLWETQCYIIANKPRIQKVADLLVAGTKQTKKNVFSYFGEGARAFLGEQKTRLF